MDSDSWPNFLGIALAAPTSSGFSGNDWFLVIILLLSLVLTATSAASETAMTSLNRIRIRNQAEEGDAQARRILRLLEIPERFLSAILVLSNAAVIAASSAATLLVYNHWGQGAEWIETILLTIFVLIFCEITPKTAAVQNPERAARALVGPVELASHALRPVTRALTFITGGIVRLLGGGEVKRGPFVTEEELRLLVEVGEQEGVLEEDEREMIHAVFELADTPVREVMVPRIDMITVEADASVDKALQVIVEGGQSRIPVYTGSIDEIIGVLYAKDLLRVLARGPRSVPVRSLVRPAYFVPESKRLDDLLRELQKRRVHMAIVVDEYGSVAGLVTIEDLVEEIIGDIKDEYDQEELLFERIGENEFVVDAKISLDELSELLDTELTSEDYDTLGGFVLAQLDKIPTAGDMAQYQNLTFTVLGTKGRRITKVRVVRSQPGEEARGDDNSPPDASDERAANPKAEGNGASIAPGSGPSLTTERDRTGEPRGFATPPALDDLWATQGAETLPEKPLPPTREPQGAPPPRLRSAMLRRAHGQGPPRRRH